MPTEGGCRSGSVLQVSDPVPLEMFTIRGRADRRNAGRKAFVTARTANTFVSYVRRKLSTSASGGAWPSTMTPALLTRTSRSSTCRAASAMLAGLGHVEHEEPGSAADLVNGLLAALRVAGADMHREPGRHELPGNFLADALVGAGDEGRGIVHGVDSARWQAG